MKHTLQRVVGRQARNVFLVTLLTHACARRSVAECLLGAPFDLKDLPAEVLHSLVEEGFLLQVEDATGHAIPFALVQLRWEDWGTLTFQTDPRGRLRFRFDQDLMNQPMDLHVFTKTDGQDLLSAPFEDTTTEVSEAQVRIWRDA